MDEIIVSLAKADIKTVKKKNTVEVPFHTVKMLNAKMKKMFNSCFRQGDIHFGENISIYLNSSGHND